jgi:prephenate dehydrogenase
MSNFNNNERRPNPKVVIYLRQASFKVKQILSKSRILVESIDRDKEALSKLTKIIKRKQREFEDLMETARSIGRKVSLYNRGHLKNNVNRFKRRFGKYRNTGENNY